MKKNPNYTYGVDTNDPEAMKRAYQKYKKKHTKITIIAAVIIGLLLLFVFDFYNVNFNNGTPLLTIKSRVDGGFLYRGVGYKILSCDDGNKYTGYITNKSCTSTDNNTSFKDILKSKFLEYGSKNNIVDKNNLLNFEINDFEFDEEIKNSTIYSVNIKYICSDGTKKCLKTNIDYYDNNRVTIYLGINKYNEIVSFDSFRTSGKLYEKLNSEYETKVKNYLINNNMLKQEQLREFTLKITQNTGMYKYNNITYANSYIININYSCKDHTNKCITYNGIKDDNLSLDMTMFIDKDNNISLLEKNNIIDK